MLLSGLVGGVLAGLLGIGGGILFVVVLPVALERMGVPSQEVAGYTIANSLFATFFSAVGAIYAHRRRQAVPWATIHWVGAPAAAAALAAQLLVVHQSWYTRQRFEGLVIVLLLSLVARSAYSLLQPSTPAQPGPAPVPQVRPGRLAGLGLAAGVVSALSGLGGGVFVVPVLRYLYAYPAQQAGLVSNGAIAWASLASMGAALLTVPAGGPHLPGQTGYLVWPLALPLALGVIVAAPLGVSLAHKASARVLTWAYILFVSLVLVRLLW